MEPEDAEPSRDRRQRRRRPRPARADSEIDISPHISEAFELVPEIGEGVRWYDYAYRLLGWMVAGWRRKLIPGRARTWLNERSNDLLQFNEHDRNKVWSREARFQNLFVPDDEHVQVGGIWVVDLFPPTEIPALERAMKRNRWSAPRAVPPFHPNNLAALGSSRAGAGRSWWRVADVVSPRSRRFTFDAHRMNLPDAFDLVEIRAVQIGSSLTAVVGHFGLTREASSALDAAWHDSHEPALRRNGGRIYPLNRREAGLRATQEARRATHEAARQWMRRRMPGSFASSGEKQPLLELLLLEKFDPRVSRPPHSNEDEVRFARVAQHDAYRAIGLDLDEFDQIKSKSLPQLVLSQPGHAEDDSLSNDPTWTLWGNSAAVASAFAREREHAGGSLEYAVAHRLDNFSSLLPLLGVVEYLHDAARRYARLRDGASTTHGKFKAGALKELRRSFLTLSLNITTMRRDVEEFWARQTRWGGVSDFKIHLAPVFKARELEAGRRVRKPVRLDVAIKEQLDRNFARLTDADRDYRDILSTVASLGASADASKLGRWALVVAIASLVVASVTILIADLGCATLVQSLFSLPAPAECASAK